jgi:hypothetical protein
VNLQGKLTQMPLIVNGLHGKSLVSVLAKYKFGFKTGSFSHEEPPVADVKHLC